MEDALSAVVAPSPRGVAVGDIERELRRLWAEAATARGETATTRALMANVVVFCRSDDECAQASRDLGALVRRHPSRVVLLVSDPSSAARQIEASVALISVGGRARAEQIVLRVGGAGAYLLVPTVREVLLGDIPTALWWATPDAPPLAGELFGGLEALADQVIYDSFGWPDPLRQLVVVARWIGGGASVAADLAWRRPRLWRRVIAETLDQALAPGAFEAISEVRIEHGPHTLSQSWLLVGWLAFRLGWQPRGGRVAPGPEVTWSFERRNGQSRVHIRRLADGESEIRLIEIATHDPSAEVREEGGRAVTAAASTGRPVTFRFTHDGPGRAAIAAVGLNDNVQSLSMPVLGRGDLVGLQLPEAARDRLFESSVGLARSMAEAVL